MSRRVVVTGLGAVTPIGNNVDDFWAAVKAGKIGFDGLITVGPLSRFLAKGAEQAGMKNVVTCDTCEEAVEKLMKMAAPGDVVLVKGSHYMHMERIPAVLRGEKA